MTDQFITQQELFDLKQSLTANVTGIVQNVARINEERFEKLEQRLDNSEQSFSVLMSGYTELVAVVEALLSSVMNTTPELREDFYKGLKESRKSFMETLKYGAQLQQDRDDKFVASSPVVDERPESDPHPEP